MTQNIAEELRAFRKKLRMTQEEFAKLGGATRAAYKNWELGFSKPPEAILQRFRAAGMGADVGSPLAPIIAAQQAMPYVGFVSCSQPVDWSDPMDSTDWVYVPDEMFDKDRFAARVEKDSMYPLLQPDDLAVFQSHPVPKVGRVCIYRTSDGRVTIKVIRHNGTNYVLHALNPSVEDHIVDTPGTCIGYLVGIVRQIGRRKITDYDPDGIIP